MRLWDATTRGGEGSWEATEEGAVLKGQRHLHHQAQKARRAALLEQMAPENRARLRSSGGPGAAAWLQALPTTPTLSLPDSHFRLASRMRLGQDTLPAGHTCRRRTRTGSTCRAPLDAKGHHAHCCGRGPQRGARHDGQRRATARIRRRHGLSCEEEVRVPQWDRARRNGTVQCARLDLRVEGGPWSPVCFVDHEVSHPPAPTYVMNAADADGATARAAESVKRHRYSRAVVPLVSETYGRLGPQALTWWRALAKQVADTDPLLAGRGSWAMAGLLSHWWAECSVALQRANAEALLASRGNRAAEGPAPTARGDTGDLPVADILAPLEEAN